MICEKCGNEMQETDKFCGMCGTPNPLLKSEEEQEEYDPYKQEKDESKEMEMTGGKAKVKRTCSLTAVIFCGVVIFLLSVACGIFAGLYFSTRSNLPAEKHSETVYTVDAGELTW